MWSLSRHWSERREKMAEQADEWNCPHCGKPIIIRWWYPPDYNVEEGEDG